MSAAHGERIERLRATYREAHDRFTRRLRDAPDDLVHAEPAGGGWTAAQIGWHVAAVDTSFAGLISGEMPGAKELPDGTSAQPWSDLAAAMPRKLEAGRRVQPPAGVRRDDVLRALADASAKLDAALAGLSEERGRRYAIAHPVIGTVALADVGEWATAHVIRHNAQAKRVLGG